MQLNNEPEYRKKEIELLGHFLGGDANYGRFSVLLLGKRGVGKSHWLKRWAEEKDYCLVDVDARHSKNINRIEDARDYWEELLKEEKDKEEEKEKDKEEEKRELLLVINDVEHLSELQQSMLLDFLSTTDGKYGFGTEKEYEVRVVFTSSYDVKDLRDGESYLSNVFFDRIAQLVVRFPSFKEFNRNIRKDFDIISKKMEFDDKNKPSEEFYKWLDKESHKFEGNFRDLDKLAILWNAYSIVYEGDTEKVCIKVKEVFRNFNHFPEHDIPEGNVFHIDIKGKKYKENEAAFKSHYKKIMKERYKTLKKAAEYAGVSHRTMEAW